VYGFEYRVAGLELRGASLELWVPGIGFRVSGFQGSGSKEKSGAACSHEAFWSSETRPEPTTPKPATRTGSQGSSNNLESCSRASTSEIVVFSPVDPSFRALSGRLKFMVRRHKFTQDSLSGLGSASMG